MISYLHKMKLELVFWSDELTDRVLRKQGEKARDTKEFAYTILFHRPSLAPFSALQLPTLRIVVTYICREEIFNTRTIAPFDRYNNIKRFFEAKQLFPIIFYPHLFLRKSQVSSCLSLFPSFLHAQPFPSKAFADSCISTPRVFSRCRVLFQLRALSRIFLSLHYGLSSYAFFSSTSSSASRCSTLLHIDFPRECFFLRLHPLESPKHRPRFYWTPLRSFSFSSRFPEIKIFQTVFRAYALTQGKITLFSTFPHQFVTRFDVSSKFSFKYSTGMGLGPGIEFLRNF